MDAKKKYHQETWLSPHLYEEQGVTKYYFDALTRGAGNVGNERPRSKLDYIHLVHLIIGLIFIIIYKFDVYNEVKRYVNYNEIMV